MNKTNGYILEGSGQAVLLLHNFASSPDELRPMAETFQKSGLSVGVPAIFTPGCSWTFWITQARRAYVELSDRHVNVSVCGAGEGVYLALILAEEYDAQDAVLLPEALPNASFSERRGLSHIKNCALRNLFSLTANVRIILNHSASPACRRRAGRLNRSIDRAALITCDEKELARTVAHCFRFGLYEPREEVFL